MQDNDNLAGIPHNAEVSVSLQKNNVEEFFLSADHLRSERDRGRDIGVCLRPWCHEWERFVVKRHRDGVSLKNFQGDYLSPDPYTNGWLWRPHDRTWERLQFDEVQINGRQLQVHIRAPAACGQAGGKYMAPKAAGDGELELREQPPFEWTVKVISVPEPPLPEAHRHSVATSHSPLHLWLSLLALFVALVCIATR